MVPARQLDPEVPIRREERSLTSELQSQPSNKQLNPLAHL